MTKRFKKVDLVADENKYAFKCLKCGEELEQEDLGTAWDNMSLDKLEQHYCPNCDITFEYYYSLDCIQYNSEDDVSGNRYIEIDGVEGDWVLPEEAVGV